MTEGADTYSRLRDFLISHMRMSHVYQPVMLKVLIQGDGKASLRAIAAAFLAHDHAQLEYYEEITKRMPGRILQSHGLVERERDGYRLALPLGDLTKGQREELVGICDAKVREYLQRRGARAYDHRRVALGELSGTIRYQVLTKAGVSFAALRLMSKPWRWTTSFLVGMEVTMRRLIFRPFVGAVTPTKGREMPQIFEQYVRLLRPVNPTVRSVTSVLGVSSARTPWRWP